MSAVRRIAGLVPGNGGLAPTLLLVAALPGAALAEVRYLCRFAPASHCDDAGRGLCAYARKPFTDRITVDGSAARLEFQRSDGVSWGEVNPEVVRAHVLEDKVTLAVFSPMGGGRIITIAPDGGAAEVSASTDQSGAGVNIVTRRGQCEVAK